MAVHFEEEKQNQKLGALRKKEEEEFAEEVAAKHGVGYLNLAIIPINIDALKLIPEDRAREAEVAAFNIVGKKLEVALRSPDNEKTGAIIGALKESGYAVEPYVVSIDSLQKAWSFYKDISRATASTAGAIEISDEEVAGLLGKIASLKDVTKLIRETVAVKKSYQVTKLIEIILAGALAIKASDVHIEPEEGYARLRYRLDGVLNDVIQLERKTFALILSRIKLISGLKLNVKNEAQDGRFSVKISGADIEIRTSILPGAYSDSVVLRILNPKSISVPLEELGIHPRLLAIVEREIARPHGMILTTGPTGSGKTTTLYAFLKKVHTTEIKIITIEDPIEYHLPGIVQTQTNAGSGYTFLEGLRSALRQDPDIIMVGEIRDKETAEIAVHAAETGHLVFSTLHTNTAAGAFPRLIDLGVNPKTLTSAINLAMAQRLVRKLCPFCKKETQIQGNDKNILDKILATIPTDYKKTLGNAAKMWVEVGCEKCNNTGFEGRVGVYEAILSNEKIEAAVRENPSEREIKEAAKNQGILDMKQDGVLKVISGVTSLRELERVIDLATE